METPDIIIFTGAGLSAESGVKTFRDTGGLWESHKIEDVCDERTWKKNFDLVHQFYNHRRTELANVKPNEAHKTIKRLQDKYGENDKLKIITQNVDNLLEQAGCRDVLHVHGFLTEMQCTKCNHVWDIGTNSFNYGIDTCPNCVKKSKEDETYIVDSKDVKPNIVFFYGAAPKYIHMYRAFDALYKPDTIVVVIGTDGSVVRIDDIIRGKKCHKILCNLHPSNHIKSSRFKHVFQEEAGTALPKIEQLIEDIIQGKI